MHQAGLEAPLFQPAHDLVFGEADVLKIGIRKIERMTGVSHHTLDKIRRGERVRCGLCHLSECSSIMIWVSREG